MNKKRRFFKCKAKLKQLVSENDHPVVEPIDCVIQTDQLIDKELRQELIKEVTRLEDVDVKKKDWYPYSQQKVLDIVHPSLFCLVQTFITEKPI